MPRKKQIRVRRWRVRVCQWATEVPVEYIIYAVDQLDARIIALALDGGFPKAMTDMTQANFQNVSRYTQVLK